MAEISYNKLWKLLIDKNLNKTKLRAMTNISSATLARMNNGQAVGLEVLLKICLALNCFIEDVVEFKYEK